MNLIPTHDFVLVEAMNPKEEMTSAGLVIPANVELTAFKLPMGIIIKVGPDVQAFVSNMKVLYSGHAGWKHTHMGKLYVLLPQREILAVVED